ncbi:hypothetical protein Tco_0903926, partial [Tanacetum coccineum]
MASAIICLATNQKFNFSKYIFESMVKNLDNVGKFLMYPRFVQVFLDKQLEGMETHDRIYIAPSHTKKIFGNMKRVGKGFSGRVTPLFPTMVVHNQEEMGKGSAMPTDPHHTPTIIQPSTSQPQKTQKPRRPKRKDTEVPQPSGPTTNVADEAVNEEMDDSLERAATTATSLDAEQDSGNINKTQSKATLNEPSSIGTSSGSGPRRQETMGDIIAQTRFENISKTSNDPLLARVLDLEQTKTTQAEEIVSLKRRVKKLEQKRALAELKSAKLPTQGIVFRKSSESITPTPTFTTTTAATTITAASTRPKDKGIVIHEQEQAPTPIQRRKHFAAKRVEEKRNRPPTRAQQRSIMCTYPKNIEGWKPKSLKNKSFANIQELFEKAMKRVNTFVDYRTELVKEREELEHESSKKQKVEEDKEPEELKQCLEIVSDDGDDVTIDATPLSIKSPTIVDYKIYQEGKKIYFQIIRANGESQ